MESRKIEYQSYDNIAQNEALINEFKGNLFEYLVGQLLAQHFKVEQAFVQSFGGELKDQLVAYQKWLMEHDRGVYLALPVLARKVVEGLLDRLPPHIQNILVMGKSAAGSHDMRFKETDIMLLTENKEIPLSLKLCKVGSYVNTKSGGIRSFFSKYFSSQFPPQMISRLEQELGVHLDESFSRMGHELYEMAGLSFEGRFDDKWTLAGLSELPGKLPPEYREVIKDHYHRVILKMHEIFVALSVENPLSFLNALYPLLGMGHHDLLQVTCFHGVVKNKPYQFKELQIVTEEDIEDSFSSLKILAPKKGLASFEIQLESMVLQIRVKPMNKFTAPALKVNCSVKK